ncbi:BglG family transcription antiterminator [Furfurilactobacillus entadae]|uniref:BglG family transcription antiterminator n=1 Tax=Furfurilactobacillus entadae TaxID=2922307 RepID=UPI0035F09437
MINYTDIKHGNELLNFLVNKNTFATLTELEDHLSLSRRGVFYVIHKVNAVLSEDRLDTILNTTGAGYFIPDETKKELLNQHSGAQPPAYRFTKAQRCQLIIWDLINHHNQSLTQLVHQFHISKHTAIADLKIVRTTLTAHGLDLVQTSTGKAIAGAEIAQRNWVLEALNDPHSFLFSQITTTSTRLDLINTEIHQLEKATGNYFTDDALTTLATFILWFLDSIATPEDQLPDSPVRKSSVDSTSINWSIKFLAAHGHNNFSEAYFLGRIINTSQFYQVNQTDTLIQQISPIARQLIDRFNTVSGANIAPQKLELTLATHLLSTFYRAKFMIPYHHPNLKQITEGFNELFSFTKYAVHPFEDFINGHLTDDEVALITLYFGGELRAIETQQTGQPDVLVVCSSGIGTSFILQQQLTQRYPEIAFSQPLSVFQYKNHDLTATKLIISTITLPVTTKVPVAQVSPLPNRHDWETIEKALLNAHLTDTHFNEANVNSLLDVISNYARIEDVAGLTDALRGYLNQRGSMSKTPAVTGLTSLSRLLPATHLGVATTPTTWQQAISIALQPLLTEHLIEPRYLQTVLDLTTTNGPYMVLGNGIALCWHMPPQMMAFMTWE